MKIIDPHYEILSLPSRDDALRLLELAGRTCYKSEDKIKTETETVEEVDIDSRSIYTYTFDRPVSAGPFIKRIMKSGHHSVIEHVSVAVKIVCSRAISHELVRHRLASYSQESQRYCNYSGGLTFIRPEWVDVQVGDYKRSGDRCLYWSWEHNGIEVSSRNILDAAYLWLSQMKSSEDSYIQLLSMLRPEQAREVLPNSTKTELVMTANLREWRHIFNLRCSPAAHPEMRRIMIPLRDKFRQWLPEIFGE